MNNRSYFKMILNIALTTLLSATTLKAVNSTWVGGVAGSWHTAANWSDGVPQVTDDTAVITNAATIEVTQLIALKTLTVNAPATVTVASNGGIAFANLGAGVLITTTDFTITGAGFLTFSRVADSDVNFADLNVGSGTTLTIDNPIIDAEGAGIELNSDGTLLLTWPANSYIGYARTSKPNGTFLFMEPGALGTKGIRIDGLNSRFAYTGAAAATFAKPIEVTAATATFEHRGSGTLSLQGAITTAGTAASALTVLTSNPGQVIAIDGTLSENTGALNLIVDGAGTTIFNGSAANSAGSITVNSGATLELSANATLQCATLLFNSTSLVTINSEVNDNFTLTLPLVTRVTGIGARLAIAAAPTASTVTMPSILRDGMGTLDIQGAEFGTARNRIFIQNMADGSLPGWITINGMRAAYDSINGIQPIVATGTQQDLAALGPATIQDDATTAAVINSAGTGGGINLAQDPTSIFSLTQAHDLNPAEVDLGGQVLQTTLIGIDSTGNNLRLLNGRLTPKPDQTPPSGVATLPALTQVPIAWYDLSDTSTVTTNSEGRITLLANKGSAGATLDAGVASGRLGPRYKAGGWNGLNVAFSDDIEPRQGLVSMGNVSIKDKQARTLFAVAERLPLTMNNFYAVHMGNDLIANQSFTLSILPANLAFVTYSNDINEKRTLKGHNVLTFITGLNGEPDAGAGYLNGALFGSKTFNMQTLEAPIHLLNRASSSSYDSGPGELAEVLLFDYTLSEQERAAVEAYLMEKWGIGTERDASILTLSNQNPLSELRLDADVKDPWLSTLSLSKLGLGDVLLGGAFNFNGAVLINEGALILKPTANHVAIIKEIVGGAGRLIKRGEGGVALTQLNSYSGGTVIEAGTLYPSLDGALGSGEVVIRDSGALDIVYDAKPTSNAIFVEGDGPDGMGALRNSSRKLAQQNAFKQVTLTDDAAVYSASRFDVRNGAFDFGGHSLTVNGGGEFSIVNSAISNVTQDTSIHVADGMMRFESSDFGGSSANLASAASGAGFTMYQMTVPHLWSLLLGDNAYLRVNNGEMNTNLNIWAGAVALSPGTARLNALSSGTAVIAGEISGSGGLLKEGPGWFWLFNANNSYAGGTTITQGNLYAVSATSLGSGGLTVADAGHLIARVASQSSPDGWSHSEIEGIANRSVFTTPLTTSLGFDTAYDDFKFTAAYPAAIGVKKLGPYKLTLAGSAPTLGGIRIYGGELDFSDSGSHYLDSQGVEIDMWPGLSAITTLRLANTTLETVDPGYQRSSPAITAGVLAKARSVVWIGEDALLRGRLVAGAAGDAAGAFYQSAGAVTNICGSSNESVIGQTGYGYYQLAQGELAHKGMLVIGRDLNSVGIIEQKSGYQCITPGSAPSTGEQGSYYNGNVSLRAGIGIVHISDGIFDNNNHSIQLGEWNSVNGYSNGVAVLTIENSAQVSAANIILANRNGAPEAYLNLNGGSLAMTYIQKGGNNGANNGAKAVVAFNGGRLITGGSGNSVFSLVRTGNNNTPALLNVYAGGAVFDITNVVGAVNLEQPLRAPVNMGVSSITVSDSGAGYIGPPAVLFSGGNGNGATAFAEIDPQSGLLTAIRVTSPGSGYTSTPTVTLQGGGYTSLAKATATLGTVQSGGLTKLGAGLLNLASNNTYIGSTIISNGTLRLGAGSGALTQNTAIEVAGGTLDLAGASLTNLNPVVVRGGMIVNGTISAPGFVKQGAGSTTLAAAPRPATAVALQQAVIHNMAPLLWYDPADAGSVTLDGSGRVISLRNKGSKANMDAASGIDNGGTALLPPMLAVGNATYSGSGLPMLKIDDNNRGLASAATVGITGGAPRTVVVVCARDSSSTGAIVAFGEATTDKMFEIGDRSSRIVVGVIGSNDLLMPTSNPQQQANVYFGVMHDSKNTEAWWTGVAPNNASMSVSATFNTTDSRFVIGQRIGVKDRGDFRGQIGEILVFDRILSESERLSLEELLSKKWMTGVQEEESAAAVTVAEGTLRLNGNEAVIAAFNPDLWYDPADESTVDTNAVGRVTLLRNKGTRGASMNAQPKSGWHGPLLTSGAQSFSKAGKPMLHIDSNTTGLDSLQNVGITGTAPRTLIAVLARVAVSDNPSESSAIVSFGSGAKLKLVELGDRSGGNCFGAHTEDLSISPILAPENANVYMMASTANNEITGWRSGGLPNRVWRQTSVDWATTDSKLCFGYRPPNDHRLAFRGQIGEVLLFSRLLSESERAEIEAYLVNKWTLPNATDLFDGVLFDVAAEATLDLSGEHKGIIISGAGRVINGALADGAVITPAGDNAIGELDLSGVTIGEGATYRVTTSGNLSDRILINGDLSGMTVVPSNEGEISGKSFVIASGNITQKPELAQFPDKFKLILRGQDLLLTSSGGTLLILR